MSALRIGLRVRDVRTLRQGRVESLRKGGSATGRLVLVRFDGNTGWPDLVWDWQIEPVRRKVNVA